jgi:hypothetical protein
MAVIANVALGAVPLAARTVNDAVPSVVGVPVMAPVEVLRDRPTGSWPLVTAHAIGDVPVALKNALTSAPTLALMVAALVIVGATADAVVVIVNGDLPLPEALVAVIVATAVPDAATVPVIAPVDVFRVRPVGSPVALYDVGVLVAKIV